METFAVGASLGGAIEAIGHEQRHFVFATRFAVEERIAFAIAQLPVRYRGLGNIDQEGDTGGQSADESCCDPSRSLIEEGECLGSNAFAAVDEAETIRVLDLSDLSVLCI